MTRPVAGLTTPPPNNKVVGWMVYASFNNILVISWRSVLWEEETAVSRENHLPVASH